jgi:hypothetical protein
VVAIAEGCNAIRQSVGGDSGVSADVEQQLKNSCIQLPANFSRLCDQCTQGTA